MDHFRNRSLRKPATPGMNHFENESFRKEVTPKESLIRDRSLRKIETSKMRCPKIGPFEIDHSKKRHIISGSLRKIVSSKSFISKISHFVKTVSSKSSTSTMSYFGKLVSSKLITWITSNSITSKMWHFGYLYFRNNRHSFKITIIFLLFDLDFIGRWGSNVFIF